MGNGKEKPAGIDVVVAQKKEAGSGIRFASWQGAGSFACNMAQGARAAEQSIARFVNSVKNTHKLSVLGRILKMLHCDGRDVKRRHAPQSRCCAMPARFCNEILLQKIRTAEKRVARLSTLL
jgi:hypothetical protein